MLTGQAPVRVPLQNLSSNASERAWFAVLASIAIFKLWLLPLQNGFWIDETGTFWAVQGGFSETIRRTLIWPAQTLVYSLIAWVASRLGGSSELVLRLPSVLASLVGVYLLYRLAARLIGRDGARAATLVFVCSEAVAFAAGDARPYALGTMAIIAGGWFLVRWWDNRTISDGIAFAVSASFIVHMHYVLAAALMVFVVYAFYRLLQGEGPSVGQILIVIAAFLVLLIPAVPHFRALWLSRQSHSFAGTPGITDFFTAMIPSLLAGSALAGFAVARLLVKGTDVCLPRLDRSTLVLIGTWTLLPSILLFGVSNVTSLKVFIPRYLLAAAPGIALLAGWILSSIRPVRAQLVVLSAMTLVPIVSSGGLVHPPHGGDWRAVMKDVRKISVDPEIPVLVRTGFIESASLTGQAESGTDFLKAELLAYPPLRPVVWLPFRMDQEAGKTLETIATSLLQSSSKFALVTSGDAGYEYWLLGRLSPIGFRIEKTTHYGGKDSTLRLITFAKSKSSS